MTKEGLTNTQASYLVIKLNELINRSELKNLDLNEYKVIVELYKELING